MINWEKIVKRHGFQNEKQMWFVLGASLRTNAAIAKHIGVSISTVAAKRQYCSTARSSRHQRTKRSAIDQLPAEELKGPLSETAEKLGISPSYLSKLKKKRRIK